MIRDLVVGVLLIVVVWPIVALLAALLLGRFLRAGRRPAPQDATPEPDLLADQPVDVLAAVEVDRRFQTITRGGPHREWWA